jgi:gamma-glutamyltranspeptidase/glutathione hydrolase
MAMSQHLALQGGVQVASRRGAVSAGHPLEVAAGLEMLAAGGSAMDAVVAGAFVACVVEPNNVSIAGYGHLSAYLAADDRFLTVDHSPRAPHRATPDMFELVDEPPEGHDWPATVGDRNSAGALSVAVPGAVRGLFEAHRVAGRLPWADVLAPAIRAAQEGVEVRWNLLLLIAAQMEAIRARPHTAQLLMPGGRLPRAASEEGPGDRLDQSDLAAVLRRIADEGPDAFHRGPVAEAIAAEVAAGGGILDAQDLADYRPLVFDEEPRTYRGLRYVTSNDTVGYEALNILEQFAPAPDGPGSAEHLHLLAEACGHAFVDSVTYFGDPEHVRSPVGGLSSKEFAKQRAAGIGRDRTAPHPVVPADPWPFDPGAGPDGAPPGPSAGGLHGTTQVVAADADGNVVSLIITIGGDFGAGLVVPGTGIVLNNSMVNYDPRPGFTNSIAPGKMPFFAVPAIVAARDGRGVLGVAGSGGYPILAGVVHATVNVLDHGLGVQAAIDEPRVHSQGHRTYVDARVEPAVRDRLAEFGHELVVQDTDPGSLAFSRVSAVALAGDGTITAGSGPAWNTAAGAL